MKRALSSLTIVLLLAAAARADLEVELPRGGGAWASLAGPGEPHRWRLRIPGGSVLDVKAKGVKGEGGARPSVSLRLLDPLGGEMIIADPRGAGTRLRKVAIAESGLYTVEVSLAGLTTGDYEITAKWRSPKKAKLAPDLAGAEVEVPFVADTGGLASFAVKGKNGVEPRLVRVTAVAGPFSRDFDPPGAGDRKHVVKDVVLGAGGDYVLTVSGTGGAAKALVKVKPPKKPREKLEISAELTDPDEDSVRGAVIGPAGGRVEAGGITVLTGSAVEVPPDALTENTVMFVGTGVSLPPQAQEEAAAGPTVRFGPAGLAFNVAAGVEIPFDPEPFEGDFSALTVYERSADGAVTLVPRETYVVDAEARIVRFPAGHFTSFRAFGPKPPDEPVDPPEPEAIFSEDFESGWGAWWASNGIWEIGEPTGGAFSGTGVAATGLAGDYPDGVHSSLVTPSIVLPDALPGEEIQFRFWNLYRLDGDDWIEVIVSEELSPGTWGNSTTLSSMRGASRVWTQHMVDLTGYAGKKVRLSLRLAQASSPKNGVGPGWFIDDVSVTVRQIVDMTAGEPGEWDFEDGWGDWWAWGGQWEIGEPTSGPNSAHQGINVGAMVLGGNYEDWAVGNLISPTVKLPTLEPGEELHLRFWHWFDAHYRDRLELRLAEELGGGARGPAVVIATYSGKSGVWSFPLVDISAHAGKTLRIHFSIVQATSPYSGVGAGWYVDEVSISKHTP